MTYEQRAFRAWMDQEMRRLLGLSYSPTALAALAEAVQGRRLPKYEPALPQFPWEADHV